MRLRFCLHIGLHGGFVVSGGFPLYKSDRAGGTCGKAVAKSVTVVIAQQLCLAVYHADGPLVAGVCAGTAAIALLLVNMNDLSYHDLSLLGIVF